jgi:benzoate membrane transport protein
MTVAPIVAGLTAAVVGCGGAIAVVFSACSAVQASPAETASWVAGLCIAIAVSTACLSIRFRLPLITAWSTPGAALIAASGGAAGLTVPTAVGAFVVAACLVLLTAAVAPLGRLIERLPMPLAAAVLAGVLLKIVAGPFEELAAAPGLVLPLIGAFLVLRLWQPSLAVVLVLIGGIPLAAGLGLLQPLPQLRLAEVVWITPVFDPAVALGLGVPLYLVTMASQNLAGFAVLRASGYADLPTRAILGVTGLVSLATAPIGAHTSNLAALSAAICTGPDADPDPARRWLSGPAYAAAYLVFAMFAPSLVAVFAILPNAFVKTIAGLALAAPMIGALVTAFSGGHDKFGPGLALAVTVSGLSLWGVGSAFWGLVAGVLVTGLGLARAHSWRQ